MKEITNTKGAHIYVLRGYAGTYDEYSTWNVCASTDHAVITARKAKLEAYVKTYPKCCSPDVRCETVESMERADKAEARWKRRSPDKNADFRYDAEYTIDTVVLLPPCQGARS